MDIQFRKWPRRNRDGRKSSGSYRAIASRLAPSFRYPPLPWANRKDVSYVNSSIGTGTGSGRAWITRRERSRSPRTVRTVRIRDALLRNPRHRTTLVTIIELPAAASDRLRFRARIAVRTDASSSFATFVVFASQTVSHAKVRSTAMSIIFVGIVIMKKKKNILHRIGKSVSLHVFQLYGVNYCCNYEL